MKLKSVFLLAVLTAVLCISSSVLAYSDGTGEPNFPYQITNVDDFQQLSATPTDWNKSFALMANIDLSGLIFYQAPIAPDVNNILSGFQGTQFTGVFDGRGHTISNLTIKNPDPTTMTQDYVGLFGYVGSGGQIKNLGVVDADITGRNYVGGLAGSNYAGVTMTDCYATGSVTGQDYIGGLVGSNYAGVSMTDCYATGSVTGRYYVGGLVGENYGILDFVNRLTRTYLDSCYATGSVSGTDLVGGLVGLNNEHSVNFCYATGSVSGHSSIGGLVGQNYRGTLTACYATGSVDGSASVGGLVGYHWGDVEFYGYVTYHWANISSCYASGSVSGSSYVGGLVGGCSNSYHRIQYSYSTGLVSGGTLVGGLVGYGSPSGCFWDTQTSGWSIGVGGGNAAGVTGKTTAQMKTLSTFLSAGWDFCGESQNGTNDYWFWPTGGGYPLLGLTCDSPLERSLTIQTDPIFITTVSPSAGEHFYRGVVNISAQQFGNCPLAYHFDHWVGDVADVNNPNTTVFMNGDKTVTAVFSNTRQCGDVCHPKPRGDINGDCTVDIADLAELASSWLKCTNPVCD